MPTLTDETPTFETFYTRFVPLVRRVLRGMIHGESYDTLEDLVQETFIRAWKGYATLNHSQNIPAWMTTIARRVGYDFLRTLHTRKQHDAPLDDDTAATLPDENQEAQVIYSGESSLIEQVYQELRPIDRQVIALLMREYTPVEIASLLHLEIHTCTARIRRARERFQAHYLALCS